MPSTSALGASLGMPLLIGQINRTYGPGSKRKDSQSQPNHKLTNDISGGQQQDKQSLRRFSLQATDFDPTGEQQRLQKKQATSKTKGVFGQMEFKRFWAVH